MNEQEMTRPRKIVAENFQLTLSIEMFSEESLGVLYLIVVSDDFSAKTDMEVSLNDFEKFLTDMQRMYHFLKGEAAIAALCGEQQFLRFTMDDFGHINVKGLLSSQGHYGHFQSLTIENDFDQTSLSDFS